MGVLSAEVWLGRLVGEGEPEQLGVTRRGFGWTRACIEGGAETRLRSRRRLGWVALSCGGLEWAKAHTHHALARCIEFGPARCGRA